MTDQPSRAAVDEYLYAEPFTTADVVRDAADWSLRGRRGAPWPLSWQ